MHEPARVKLTRARKRFGEKAPSCRPSREHFDAQVFQTRVGNGVYERAAVNALVGRINLIRAVSRTHRDAQSMGKNRAPPRGSAGGIARRREFVVIVLQPKQETRCRTFLLRLARRSIAGLRVIRHVPRC